MRELSAVGDIYRREQAPVIRRRDEISAIETMWRGVVTPPQTQKETCF